MACYHDEEWLRAEYVDAERTTTDIADECDVTAETIRRWLNKHDIDLRVTWLSDGEKEQIRERYRNTTLKQKEIAEEFGVSEAKVSNIVSDIDRYEPASLYQHVTERGYVSYQLYYGGEHVARFYEHQVVALLDGYEMGGSNVVHHENGVPWDNRPENLSVMSREEHQKNEMNGPIGNKGKEHWRKSKNEPLRES